MRKYTFAYKKPGKSRIKQHIVYAENEKEALKLAPNEIIGGWLRYGLLSVSEK